MTINDLLERAQGLREGETLKITQAENDAIIQAFEPLFSAVIYPAKITPEYAVPCHLRGHEIEVI